MKQIIISEKMLASFKSYAKVNHTSEDEYLKDLIAKSYANLQSRFGDFDIENNLVGRDLVFARTRYAYEDLTEYFNDNYQDDLVHFGLNNVIGSDRDENKI